MIARTARRFFLIAALVLVLALVPVALAAKGGGKPTGGGGGLSAGTISLVVLTSPGDGLAHSMYTVTFNVSTSATQYPWVTVDCHNAAGAWVYHASDAMYVNEVFTLGSNTWMSGDADCTATLQNWDNYSSKGSITNLASTTFHVYA